MNGDEKKFLTDMQLQIVKSAAEHETWAKAHDARLEKIESNVAMTNAAVQRIGSKVAIIEGQGAARDKRISREADRVDVLELRLRKQEDTGVHHIGELEGATKAKEATRKGFLFAFAVLGGIGTIGGITVGILRVTGCGG